MSTSFMRSFELFIMDIDRKYTLEELEKLSYRTLQQIAKCMSLPSNVKKMYLIELILAKTYKTAAEVESIVLKVRSERQRITMNNNKKKGVKHRLQGAEITSTNTTCQSPPIDLTPKRLSSRSPDHSGNRSLIKYPRPTTSPKRSDRVLRSTIRTYKPNYSLLNDSFIEVFKESESKQSERQISIVEAGSRYPRLKMAARCLVKKIRPTPSKILKEKERLMLALNENKPSAIVPIRRELNTLCVPEKSKQTYLQSIGFRHSNGKVSKINAIVHRETPKSYNLDHFPTPNTSSTYRNVQVTIQDIINSNIEEKTSTKPTNTIGYTWADSSKYPNLSVLGDHSDEGTFTPQNDEEMSSFSIYYHKKIRSEQLRNKRDSPPAPRFASDARPPLPRIHNAFSRFRDVTQPIYVRVEPESDALGSTPVVNKSGWVLENLYSLRRVEPLPVVSTAFTKSVFSSPTVTTHLPHYSALGGDVYHFNPSYEQSAGYGNYCTSDEVSRVCDLMGEQDMTLRRYHEAANTSNSSLESEQFGASVTIPEMVEDALELISQDGDYMERISMDVRMQCVLCSWAGPKFVLERHVRDEHSEQIAQQQNKEDWVITYKLGSLVQQPIWLSNVCERQNTLYILSAKYQDPERLMVSLTTLSSDSDHIGTITLYNKVTGEPFVWQGVIQELPINMPYENTDDCLQIDLSKLELIPNSANLKLHNRSLVLNSPSKVVVGQPELNDIHIIVFVKIQEIL